MVFKKITLHKYKRFTMHQEDTYTLNLTPFIILTWKNGYGKSSLLYQINVLPIDKKDFDTEGYKEIQLEHNNITYTIYSSYTKHSLLEDGVELNPSYNKKTYLELVKEKFNITPNILNYVNGYQTLTKMSANERKDVLFSISNLDYTYALSLYSKLAETYRDTQALLKYQSGKLNNIIEMTKEVELTNIEEQLDKLEELKVMFYRGYREQHEIRKDEVLSKVEEINTLYDSVRVEDPQQDLTKLQQEVDTTQAKVKVLEELRRTNQIKLEELSHVVDQDQILQVKKNLTNLELSYNNILATITNPHIQQDAKKITQELKSNTQALLSVLDTEYEDLDPNLVRENDKKLMINGLALYQAQAMLQHYKNILSNSGSLDTVKCDNCGHKINMKAKQANLEQEIKQQELAIEKMTKRDEELRAIQNIEKKNEKHVELVNRRLAYLGIQQVKEEEYSSITKQSLYNEYKNYYSAFLELEELQTKITQYQQELEQLLKHKGMEKSQLEQEMNKVLEEDRRLLKEITDTKAILQNLKQHLTKLTEIENNKKNLRVKLREYKKLEVGYKIQLINNFVTNSLEQINLEIRYLQEKKKHNDNLELERKTVVDEIAKLQEDLQDYQLLLDKLSPKHGLIAKSINSFIGVIVTEMNNIINTVWSYDLKILTCSVDEGNNLDFKFRVKVNNDRVVDDVRDMSSSMKEIVDLAFRLVYIKYMDFKNIPLILDEFGSTMDQEHAKQAFDMIEDVLRNSFEQVFLVSHFDSMYGRFKNVDIPTVS